MVITFIVLCILLLTWTTMSMFRASQFSSMAIDISNAAYAKQISSLYNDLNYNYEDDPCGHAYDAFVLNRQFYFYLPFFSPIRRYNICLDTYGLREWVGKRPEVDRMRKIWKQINERTIR